MSDSLSKKICTTALALVTVFAHATSASAQSVPNKADSTSASGTLSSAQSAKAHSADAKKKQKPAPKPDPNPSAAAMSASPTGSLEAAQQAQNPLTPLYSILSENYTNFGVGQLHRTQDALLVEPIIPIRLTPEFNLVTRWITPVVWQPALAPSIGAESGLGNITPQFFFTPAHKGDGFVWALGANAWLPTATDNTLGINKWGGGPTAVALWIQGPLLTGVLTQNTWAGNHGSSLTGKRVNQLLVKPFVFYNLSAGWYLASLPNITADWTVHNHKWTVPIGGGIGRVIPVGDTIMNARFDVYYNNALGHASGDTNVGNWTALFTLHFLFPNVKTPSLFDEVSPAIVRN
jgi:hypothetical protein